MDDQPLEHKQDDRATPPFQPDESWLDYMAGSDQDRLPPRVVAGPLTDRRPDPSGRAAILAACTRNPASRTLAERSGTVPQDNSEAGRLVLMRGSDPDPWPVAVHLDEAATMPPHS